MSPSLRSQLVRLAHARPDLRPHLLPILREAAEKVAHGPVALARPDVMLYQIDAGSNASKFYEMVVVPQGSETAAKKTKRWTGDAWVLCRRWGRLTDVGGVTGRVDSMNDTFASKFEAERAMDALRREKTGKGYEDVSRTREYPIGLGGAGFGWGGQAACAYLPELRQLHETVDPTLSAFLRLRSAVVQLARRNSSMGKKLALLLEATVTPLLELDSYLDSQLAECSG